MVGLHVEQVRDVGVLPGLLRDLADERMTGALARINATTRQAPQAGDGGQVGELCCEQAARRKDDAVRGKALTHHRRLLDRQVEVGIHRAGPGYREHAVAAVATHLDGQREVGRTSGGGEGTHDAVALLPGQPVRVGAVAEGAGEHRRPPGHFHADDPHLSIMSRR